MVLEYRVNWSYGPGSPGVSVFHGRGEGVDPASESAIDMASRVGEFFDALSPAFGSQVTWSFPDEVLDLNTTTGVLEAVWPVDGHAPISGDQANAAAAAPAGAHVTWRTPAIVAGRRLIGRTFLVPLPVGSYEADGSLSGSLIAAIVAATDVYQDQTFFGSFQPTVWSRTHGIQADITSATVPDFTTVLRSRRD